LLFLYLASPAPPALSTLSLHDALPICARLLRSPPPRAGLHDKLRDPNAGGLSVHRPVGRGRTRAVLHRDEGQGDRSRSSGSDSRSEEHTSELQSRRDLVCRLLLEKKKT